MAERLAVSLRRRVTAEAAEVASAITRIAATSAPRRMFGRSSWLRSGTSGFSLSAPRAELRRRQARGAQRTELSRPAPTTRGRCRAGPQPRWPLVDLAQAARPDDRGVQ